MGTKAANQNINGLNTDTAILDDYVPPTPEERGDYVDDEPEYEQDVELDEQDDAGELEDEHEEDEQEDDEQDDFQDDGDDAGEEEEEADEEEEAERPPKNNKGANKRRVPLDRLNKEIEKRRALEAELERERARNSAPAPKAEEAPAKEVPSGYTREDFEEMQEAMLDGETDKAFEVFGKILASQSQAVQSKAEAEVADRVRSELDQDRAMSELRQTAVDIAASYPELDSTGDDADQGLIEEVVEMRDLYVERGLTPAEALKKSVRLVALENGLKDRKAKPKADLGAPPVKRVNSKKKLEAARRERGKLQGSGGNNARPEIDLAKLSADAFDEAFSNLSAEAKARARGDYIA